MTTIDLAQLQTTEQVQAMVTDLVGAVRATEGFRDRFAARGTKNPPPMSFNDRFAARGKPTKNSFINRFAARSKPNPAKFSARFAARGKISIAPFGDRFIARSKDVPTQTFYVGSL